MRRWFVVLALASVMCLGGVASAQDAYMGDWTGTAQVAGQADQPLAVYMIARGDGRYEARIFSEFNRRVPLLYNLTGNLGGETFALIDSLPWEPARILRPTDDGLVVAASLWNAQLAEGGVTGTIAGALKGTFTLRQTVRQSPTLGAEAPAGAVVLFDGDNLDAWAPVGRPNDPAPWRLLEGGVMEVQGGDIQTRQNFQNYRLHIEFRLPYMPHASGQGRANSGVYQQGRYEVQVLDSYGLDGADNECGGIYQIARPNVNMCLPPLAWQAYDIEFYGARLGADGQKTANARMTVVHNGVVIHDDLELPKVTGGANDENEGTPGPIKLQDHGNPVQFRNIWIEPLP